MAYESMDDKIARLAPRIIKFAALGIVGLVLVFGSFYSVEQGHMGVVKRFGAVTQVVAPGGHFKLPLVDSVEEIGTRTQSLEWGVTERGDARMESYSKDQQPAHIGVKVVYNVKTDPKSVTTLYSQYRDSSGYANTVIIPRALEAVKTVFGQFNAVGVIQDRAKFNAAVAEKLHSLVPADGPVLLESVQIQDITFSDAYEKAVEARMQAEVAVAKVSQDLERERKQAEIAVVQAEATAKSTRLAGEAEAAAIRARGDALRESPKLVELVLAEKWNGVLPTTMVPGGAVPFVGVK